MPSNSRATSDRPGISLSLSSRFPLIVHIPSMTLIFDILSPSSGPKIAHSEQKLNAAEEESADLKAEAEKAAALEEKRVELESKVSERGSTTMGLTSFVRLRSAIRGDLGCEKNAPPTSLTLAIFQRHFHSKPHLHPACPCLSNGTSCLRQVEELASKLTEAGAALKERDGDFVKTVADNKQAAAAEKAARTELEGKVKIRAFNVVAREPRNVAIKIVSQMALLFAHDTGRSPE